MVLISGLLIPWTAASTAGSTVDPTVAQQERRIEFVIRSYEFQLTQPAPIRLHMPTIIILRNRDKWNHSLEAVGEMLEKTSTTWAPWTVVEANDKYHARVKVVRTVTEALGRCGH